MNDFGSELGRLMEARGIGVRELARAAYCNPGHISNLRSGKARPSLQLADTLDKHLEAGGKLAAIAARSARVRQRGRATRSSEPSRAVEALQVAMSDNGGASEIAEDGLGELVHHYAYVAAVAPSVAVYDEIVSARSFAGMLIDRGSRPRLPELAVTTGWLSSLLAISAVDLGDHATALVWCADTERRGRDARHPELLGWAALTRSLIAWYQGDPALSAARAGRDRRGGSGRGGGAGIRAYRVANHGASQTARPVPSGQVAWFPTRGGFPCTVHRRDHATGASHSPRRRAD
jgi:transcriptional regulator with XRE-family HTH domain